jgi:hypothetical protein
MSNFTGAAIIFTCDRPSEENPFRGSAKWNHDVVAARRNAISRSLAIASMQDLAIDGDRGDDLERNEGGRAMSHGREAQRRRLQARTARCFARS